MFMAYKKRKKRTLSEDQLRKMREGRERAAAARAAAATQKERMEMVNELDKKIRAAGRASSGNVRIRAKRRKRYGF